MLTHYSQREVRNSIYRYRKIHIDYRSKFSYRFYIDSIDNLRQHYRLSIEIFISIYIVYIDNLRQQYFIPNSRNSKNVTSCGFNRSTKKKIINWCPGVYDFTPTGQRGRCPGGNEMKKYFLHLIFTFYLQRHISAGTIPSLYLNKKKRFSIRFALSHWPIYWQSKPSLKTVGLR